MQKFTSNTNKFQMRINFFLNRSELILRWVRTSEKVIDLEPFWERSSVDTAIGSVRLRPFWGISSVRRTECLGPTLCRSGAAGNVCGTRDVVRFPIPRNPSTISSACDTFIHSSRVFPRFTSVRNPFRICFLEDCIAKIPRGSPSIFQTFKIKFNLA